MKKTFLLLSVLLASILSFSFISCTEDDEESQEDDNPVVLSDYIFGKWKTYKLVTTIDDKEYTVPLNKNGTNSGQLKNAYYELTFQENDECITGLWYHPDLEDEQWIENPATYSIDGNTVILHEGGRDTEITFDEQSKDLFFSGTSVDGKTFRICLRK